MNPIKVLVFTSLYPNNIWPNNNVFVKERMSTVSRMDGIELKVIAPVPYYPPIQSGWRQNFSKVKRQEVLAGVEVYHPRYFITPKIGMVLYGLLMFLSVLPVVKKIRKEFDFDLIDAHYVYPDGFAAVLLADFFRIPVVVSARGTDINLYKEFPLIRQLLRHTLLKADKAISVCQALKDEMIQLGIPAAKISVIPNGVDSSKFYPLSKEVAKRNLGIPTDKKLILSVGSLIPRKGFDLLIRAIKVLGDRYHKKDLFLAIVGEGKLRGDLEKLISSLNLDEHVFLVGAKPHQELYCWYNAADLFCLASSREGWPNVVMESLACGTPVVATEVWGVPEIIQSDKIGLLAKRSVPELAKAISLALQRQWNSPEIVEYVRENTWNRVAFSVCQVFKSVLQPNGLQ